MRNSEWQRQKEDGRYGNCLLEAGGLVLFVEAQELNCFTL